MPRRDPRVDKYIDKAPAYARPILRKLRDVLLGADKTLEEDIKWGAPTLMKDGMVCSYMGFRKHVALWFHKGTLLEDPAQLLNGSSTVAMRAAHFTRESQVKIKPITAMLKQAVKLNLSGVRAPKRSATKKAVAVPKERPRKSAAAKTASARKPAKKKASAKKPAKRVAKKTAKAIARKPAKRAAKKSTKKPARKPAKRVAKKAAKATARKPAKRAAKKRTKAPAKKPAKKSAGRKKASGSVRRGSKSASKKGR